MKHSIPKKSDDAVFQSPTGDEVNTQSTSVHKHTVVIIHIIVYNTIINFNCSYFVFGTDHHVQLLESKLCVFC